MRHLDLFSGIGGFALAATWVWGDDYENVGHSEIEKYPCKVYHNHFPESECLGDITKIDWSRFAGTIDLVTGGFPCQPHSVAGKRQGSGDERDLWSECVRTIRELRPRFALFENVPGLFSSNGGRFFNRVLSDISASGYDAEWQVISAAQVGAWHRRERVWIVCYPTSVRCLRCKGRESGGTQEERRVPESITRNTDAPDTENGQDDGRNRRGVAEAASGRQGIDPAVESGGEDVSDSDIERLERFNESKYSSRQFQATSGRGSGDVPDARSGWRDGRTYRSGFWEREPLEAVQDAGRGGGQEVGLSIPQSLLGRVAHGVPNRVERLKALGNAIVPQVAAVIMERIRQLTPEQSGFHKHM